MTSLGIGERLLILFGGGGEPRGGLEKKLKITFKEQDDKVYKIQNTEGKNVILFQTKNKIS